MEKNKKNIERLVDETLSSLDDVGKISPRPFFYSRLRARLDNRQEIAEQAFYLSPSLKKAMVAVVIFLMILNTLTVSLFLGNSGNSGSVISESQYIEETYYPVTPTVYNLENNLTP